MQGFPIHGDLKEAGSTNIAMALPQGPTVPRPPQPLGLKGPPTGLVPPVPLALTPGDLQVQASTNMLSVAPPPPFGPPMSYRGDLQGQGSTNFHAVAPPPFGPPRPFHPRGVVQPAGNRGDFHVQASSNIPAVAPPPVPLGPSGPISPHGLPPAPPSPPGPGIVVAVPMQPIAQHTQPQPQYLPPPQHYAPALPQQFHQQPSNIQQQYVHPPQQQQSSLQRHYAQLSQHQPAQPVQQPSIPQPHFVPPPAPTQQLPLQQIYPPTQAPGWVPLDNDGSRLAKGVGVRVSVDDDIRKAEFKGNSLSSRPRTQGDSNELEIIPTNSVKVDDEDVVIGKSVNSPVYPGRSSKVVIHAQNVIIRGGPDGGTIEDIYNNTASNVRQYQAYQNVPRVNPFLRNQLRNAAMSQLLQSAMTDTAHPLSEKPFPRPLSLREIAQAVRSGEFPQPTRDQLLNRPSGSDPMSTQSSAPSPNELEINIPHKFKLAKDSLTQGSIASGNQYDPREALEYSLLAQIAANRQRASHRPPSTLDYGDSVKYSADDPKREPTPSPSLRAPIQVVETDTQPLLQQPIALLSNSGNLRDISGLVLKNLLLQELKETDDEHQVLLPAGLGPQAPPIDRPLRTLKHVYGDNGHPFSDDGTSTHVIDETIEYEIPPGVSIEDVLAHEGKGHDHEEEHHPEGEEPLPLNKDTLVRLGKVALNKALLFSRHHNPLTFLEKVAQLPPVQVELYKVPVNIPNKMVDKLPLNWKITGGPEADHHHHHHHHDDHHHHSGLHHHSGHHHGPPRHHHKGHHHHHHGKKHQYRKQNLFTVNYH